MKKAVLSYLNFRDGLYPLYLVFFWTYQLMDYVRNCRKMAYYVTGDNYIDYRKSASHGDRKDNICFGYDSLKVAYCFG